jgi:hypothetical protein
MLIQLFGIYTVWIMGKFANARFEVFEEVAVKNAVFWDVMPPIFLLSDSITSFFI